MYIFEIVTGNGKFLSIGATEQEAKINFTIEFPSEKIRTITQREEKAISLDEKAKVYVVGYYDCYDAYHLVAGFSTENKAKTFIEDAKKPFYKDKVLYDYRSYHKDLYIEDMDLDEFENRISKS
jgi:hypothetical protein